MFAFFDGGAENELTLAANRAASPTCACCCGCWWMSNRWIPAGLCWVRRRGGDLAIADAARVVKEVRLALTFRHPRRPFVEAAGIDPHACNHLQSGQKKAVTRHIDDSNCIHTTHHHRSLKLSVVGLHNGSRKIVINLCCPIAISVVTAIPGVILTSRSST